MEKKKREKGILPLIPKGVQRWILILSVPFWVICTIVAIGLYTSGVKGATYLIGAIFYALMSVLAIYAGSKSRWLRNIDETPSAARVAGGIAIVGTGIYFAILAAMISVMLLVIILSIMVMLLVVSLAFGSGAAIGGLGGGVGGGGGGSPPKPEKEEYYTKVVSGKMHLFERRTFIDEDLGELHKTPSWDSEYEFETQNIIGENYKIGRKDILSEERDFYKVDKKEKGKLVSNLFGQRHWDYKPDDQQ